MFGQNVSLAHWLRIATVLVTFVVETTGQTERTIVQGGRTRWFVEHNATFQKGNPVIISLHAGGANMRRCTVQDFKESNNLVLCPNGADPVSLRTDPGPQTKYWNIYPEYSFTSNPKVRDDFATIDDVGFIAAMAKWAVVERGADPNRVYLFGLSLGGLMAYRAVIETYPPLYAAVATIVSPLPVWTKGLPKPNTTTPMFMMMGTKDKVAQWTGGSIPEGNLPYESAGRTKDFWIDANKADKSKVQLTKLRNRNRWDGCTIDQEVFPPTDPTNGSPVEFYTMNGGGHMIPKTSWSFQCWALKICEGEGYSVSALGPVCTDVNALPIARDFLLKHTRKA
jgi:polyhydroxybutyrate depolymerase